VGFVVLAGLGACGTESADVNMQAVDSSEAALADHTTPTDTPTQSVDENLSRKPGCPPAQGNTKGVGRPCTKNGGQCRGSGAPFCTVDVSSTTTLAFCTKICFSSDQCGPNATCASNPRSPGMKGCVPNACL
jgi:hypothetical protein